MGTREMATIQSEEVDAMRICTLLLAGYAAALVGCDSEPESAPPAAAVADSGDSVAPAADGSDSVAEESPVGPMTYVSLKVPNMV